MKNNNQEKYDKFRGRIDVVATLMTAKNRNGDHKEDPAVHGKFLNSGTRTLDLLGIGKQIRSQEFVIPLRVSR